MVGYASGDYVPLDLNKVLNEVSAHWAHWALHLGLQNWRATIRQAACENDEECTTVLSVQWPNGYKHAYVDVHMHAELHGELEGEALRNNVLHEVCHLLLCEISEFADSFTEDSVMGIMVDHAIESGADTITTVVLNLHQQMGCQVGA